MNESWFVPEWKVHPRVRSAITFRGNGFSSPPYDSFNLAKHVEDDSDRVDKNRALLRDSLLLPNEPKWLCQTHSTRVVEAANIKPDSVDADASVTSESGVICAVLTADCLPILLANEEGSRVSAVHAGWRGLLDGVVQASVACFAQNAAPVSAFLGPAIGPQAFEIGADVHDEYCDNYPSAHKTMRVSGENKWLFDIYQMARFILNDCGVDDVSGGNFCTYTDRDRFFSYRRDQLTGRMASLIWLENPEVKPLK